MEAGLLATRYAYNCRAGASPADPSNGKRERLPYKSVVGVRRSEDTSSEQRARSREQGDAQPRLWELRVNKEELRKAEVKKEEVTKRQKKADPPSREATARQGGSQLFQINQSIQRELIWP